MIDAAFFPHIVQEVFDHADLDTLLALSQVNRSFHQAATRRLRPYRHFNLNAADVPESIHLDLTAWYLYELTGRGARVLADAMHFHWGAAGSDWHDFEGAHTPIPESERGHKWTFEYYDAEEEVYLCPKQDGRVDSFEEIPAADMNTLKRARVLDIHYPLSKAESFLNTQLMPNLHTARFPAAAPPMIQESLSDPPAVERIVFFDNPGRWFKPVPYNEDFNLCSDRTAKVVIHQKNGRKGRDKDAMCPPAPMPPSKRLQELAYIFTRWGLDKNDNGARSLDRFLFLMMWAAMEHDVKVTVVGLQDLDPAIFRDEPLRITPEPPGECQKEKPDEYYKSANYKSIVTGEDIVAYFKQKLVKIARIAKNAEFAEKAQKNVTFLTRDAYRDAIGEEEFGIETDVDYHKRHYTL